MKYFFIFTGTLVFFLLLSYLSGCFMNANFNISTWIYEFRIVFCVTSLLFSIILAYCTTEEILKINK